MLLSDITILYWSRGEPTVMCACSYEPVERHRLLCYCVYERWCDGNGTVNSSGPHTRTHAVHTYSTTVGRSDSWLSLFCEWSLVQMCDCIIINIHFYILCLSLWSPGRRRNHVQQERSEEVHLSVLIISKFSFFPFVSFLLVFNSLSPPTLITFLINFIFFPSPPFPFPCQLYNNMKQ